MICCTSSMLISLSYWNHQRTSVMVLEARSWAYRSTYRSCVPCKSQERSFSRMLSWITCNISVNTGRLIAPLHSKV